MCLKLKVEETKSEKKEILNLIQKAFFAFGKEKRTITAFFAEKYRKTAKKNIKTYKMLLKLADGKLVTPIFQKRMVSEKMYSSKFSFSLHTYLSAHRGMELHVDRGMHSFVSREAAMKTWNKWKKDGSIVQSAKALCKEVPDAVGMVVVECTIPKGTEYYIGNEGDIVSNFITIGEVVTASRGSIRF